MVSVLDAMVTAPWFFANAFMLVCAWCSLREVFAADSWITMTLHSIVATWAYICLISILAGSFGYLSAAILITSCLTLCIFGARRVARERVARAIRGLSLSTTSVASHKLTSRIWGICWLLVVSSAFISPLSLSIWHSFPEQS